MGMISFKDYLVEFTQQQHEELEEVLKTFRNRRVVFTTLDHIDGTRKYEQEPNSMEYAPTKPKGMWYALGGEWNNFLKYWDHQYIYQNVFYVDIDYTNILRINTKERFENFTQQYNLKPEKEGFFIDWIRVAKEYKGIEIIPMRHESKLKHFWYYGWDIPSGCIWDTSAIKNSTKIYPNFDQKTLKNG